MWDLLRSNTRMTTMQDYLVWYNRDVSPTTATCHQQLWHQQPWRTASDVSPTTMRCHQQLWYVAFPRSLITTSHLLPMPEYRHPQRLYKRSGTDIAISLQRTSAKYLLQRLQPVEQQSAPTRHKDNNIIAGPAIIFHKCLREERA